jgi:hypothetical protein
VHRTSPDDSHNRDGEFARLGRAELHRLTLFKWRYTLESLGFGPREVEDLLFLTWLRATARVHG